MEEMQQKGEVWKSVAPLLQNIQRNRFTIIIQRHQTSRILTPSFTPHSKTTCMSRKQQRKETKNLHKCCIEMKPSSLDHLACLKKIKAYSARNTTTKNFSIYGCFLRNDVRLSLNVLTLVLEDFTSRGNKFQNFGISVKIDLILWISKR